MDFLSYILLFMSVSMFGPRDITKAKRYESA